MIRSFIFQVSVIFFIHLFFAIDMRLVVNVEMYGQSVLLRQSDDKELKTRER